MAFEQYERSGDSASGQPQVSLRASGSIGVNNGAVDAYFESADYVRLYHDRETARVGIEPRESDSGDEYSLQRGEAETHGATVYAGGFLREYDLIPDRTATYPATWDEDAGLVAVDLDEPVGRGNGERVRPDPTETHATVSWVDDVSGADNVLLAAPGDADWGHACAALLATADTDQTGLVAVTHDRSADEWLTEYDRQTNERPDEVVLVDVDPPADAAAVTDRADGVTVATVPDLGDLTGIGIPLADHATRVRDDAETLVVCVDSVSELLDHSTVDETADFLEVVTARISDWATGSTDVRAHYHLDADAHRGSTVDAFDSLMDVTVTLDDDGEAAGIRR